MSHQLLMYILMFGSTFAIGFGMAMVVCYGYILNRVERSPLFNDEMWDFALAGTALGIVLVILGIIGILTWAALS